MSFIGKNFIRMLKNLYQLMNLLHREERLEFIVFWMPVMHQMRLREDTRPVLLYL